MIEVFKTRVKKRIDRIKQVRLLHILYHTHPADLGIVLQMKSQQKFRWVGGGVSWMRIMREKMESKEKENEGYERNGRDRRRRELGDGGADEKRKGRISSFYFNFC